MIASVTASDGVPLAVEVCGVERGSPVVLLHSPGCSRRIWAPQLAALAQNFRVIVPDARGHGASAAPPGDTTLERLGSDVLDVMDATGLEAAHVCGISMGGLVAQWLAINAPDRVRHLVLANTACRLGSVQSWSERAATVRAQGMAAIADTVLARFLGAAFRLTHPDIEEEFRAQLLGTPAHGYAAACAALRNADLTHDVGRILSPTLVIGGMNDISTPPALASQLAAAIPGAALLILPASHLSNVEQAHAFTAALMAHLATRPA